MKNLVIASILGFISVTMGAFGAHALEDILEPDALKNYETAVRYMLIHALVLLFLNIAPSLESKQKNTLSYLFLLGIIFFSGSIFAISLGIVKASSIWFITPLGGMLLIGGWIGMAIAFFRKSRS